MSWWDVPDPSWKTNPDIVADESAAVVYDWDGEDDEEDEDDE